MLFPAFWQMIADEGSRSRRSAYTGMPVEFRFTLRINAYHETTEPTDGNACSRLARRVGSGDEILGGHAKRL